MAAVAEAVDGKEVAKRRPSKREVEKKMKQETLILFSCSKSGWDLSEKLFTTTGRSITCVETEAKKMKLQLLFTSPFEWQSNSQEETWERTFILWVSLEENLFQERKRENFLGGSVSRFLFIQESTWMRRFEGRGRQTQDSAGILRWSGRKRKGIRKIHLIYSIRGRDIQS